jgi:hypothetical protein
MIPPSTPSHVRDDDRRQTDLSSCRVDIARHDHDGSPASGGPGSSGYGTGRGAGSSFSCQDTSPRSSPRPKALTLLFGTSARLRVLVRSEISGGAYAYGRGSAICHRAVQAWPPG